MDLDRRRLRDDAIEARAIVPAEKRESCSSFEEDWGCEGRRQWLTVTRFEKPLKRQEADRNVAIGK